MPSKPATVAEYLEQLPPDRREAIEAVRKVIRENLDKDYEEGIQYGMIGYYVPHRVFPDGYHCDPKQPLPFMSVASTKGHIGLHMFCIYGDMGMQEWFRDAWKKAGKKLDMGAACVRVKKLEDIALDVVGEAVRRLPTAKFVQHYVRLRDGIGLGKAGKAAAAARTKADGTGSKTAKKAGSAKPGVKASAKPAAGKKVAKTAAMKAGKKTAKKAGKKTGKKVGKKVARAR